MTVMVIATLVILIIFTVLNILDVYTTLKLGGGFKKTRRNWDRVEANPIMRESGLVWGLIIKFGALGYVWGIFFFIPLLINLEFWFISFSCFVGTIVVWHNTKHIKEINHLRRLKRK